MDVAKSKKLTIKQKRERIKFILSKLSDGNRKVFMQMYSHSDLTKDLNLVIDEIPAKKVSWALTQCENSYYYIFKILAGKV